MSNIVDMKGNEVEPVAQVKEDHKATISFEDVEGTTHIRLSVDDHYLDTPQGRDLFEDLTERCVDTQAVKMAMILVDIMASWDGAKKMEGEYTV